MKRFVGFGILLCILFLVLHVEAKISLGSTSDVNGLDLKPGEYAVFSASFFNMGDESLDVDLEVEYPSDLRIEVVPSELRMESSITGNPSSPGEWLILDGGKRYVKTHPVEVYLKIPSTISRNTYNIKLIATAKGSESAGGEGFKQSLVQVREVVFTAKVPGQVSGEYADVIRIDASSGDAVMEEAQKSLTYSQGSSSLSPAAGGSSGSGSTATGSSGSAAYGDTTTGSSGGSEKTGLVTKDSGGNTHINLPTGEVTLSEGQTGLVIDLGLVTLIISVGSLIVRVLK
ncbi:MAG: hypothetical protein JW778_03685 [Candidatus Altiarchaeota archaeon]|nr:hypothetical protein [Candidatus Altiarchaeota archaeon]